MEKVMIFVKEKVAPSRRQIINALLALLAGFLCSMGKVLGLPGEINVAAAVLSGDYILASAAGSVAAYAAMGSVSAGMVQLCAILMIAGVRFIMPADKLTFFGRHNEAAFTSLMTGAVLMLFGSVVSLSVPTDAFTVSLRMINALLCGCTVYCAMTVIKNYRFAESFDIQGLNGMYIGILYVIAVSVLSSLDIGVIDPGRALGCFCVLLGIKRYRQTGGAVMGALTTCGVLLCSPALARNTLLLATSGLISGVFWSFGAVVTVGVFIFISLVSLAAMGVNQDTMPMFADILLGSLVFLALPMPVFNNIREKFSILRISGFKSPVEHVSQTTLSKLSFASQTIGEIREQLSQISTAMQRREQDTDVSDEAIRNVCAGCTFSNSCFAHLRQLKWSMGKLERVCMKYNCIRPADVEKHLSDCQRPEYMSRSFNRTYRTIVARRAGNMRISEMRGFLGEQLSSMEDVLNDLSVRVGSVRQIDAALSAQVRRVFDDLGYPNARACVYVDENLRRRVEVYLTAKFCGDMSKLTLAVSSAADCDLDLPVITRSKELTRLCFTPAPVFSAEIGSFCASMGDGCSGDSYDVFNVSATEKYVLLSDGMGTGKRARLDSVFTISLVSRLIRCGISMTTAHKMVNSMLRVKGWEESFATLDLLRLDLCGASARILKSGAAPSYLCRDGGVRIMSCDAFPAGILPCCPPDIVDLKLFDGDIIMLASDGVDKAAAKKLCELSLTGIGVEEMCRVLGHYCIDLSDGELKDDATIILVRVSRSA